MEYACGDEDEWLFLREETCLSRARGLEGVTVVAGEHGPAALDAE